MARAVAVLGDRRPAEVLAAAAELDVAEVSEALPRSRSRARRLDPPRYVHPLIGQAVAERVSARTATRLHHRAAEALRHRPGSDEEVVVHLLAARPCARTGVLPLLRAARRAMGEGAPEAAVRRLTRALEEGMAAGPELDALYLELARAAARRRPERARPPGRRPESHDPGSPHRPPSCSSVGARPRGEPARHGRTAAGRCRAPGPEANPALHDRCSAQLLNVLFVDSRLASGRAEILASAAQADAGPGVMSHRAWDAAAGDARPTRGDGAAALTERPFCQLGGDRAAARSGPCSACSSSTATAMPTRPSPTPRRRCAASRHALGRSFTAFMRAEWQLAFGSAAMAESNARESLELRSRRTPRRGLRAGGAASALVLRGALDEPRPCWPCCRTTSTSAGARAVWT